MELSAVNYFEKKLHHRALNLPLLTDIRFHLLHIQLPFSEDINQNNYGFPNLPTRELL